MTSSSSRGELSNWGRWGADDERGCLNLITPEMVREASTLVRTGKSYSLAMPLDAEGPQWPERHRTWRVTTSRRRAGKRGSCDDVITLHSHSGTHMDALCHVWYDDRFYNGFDLDEHLSSQGSTRCSIDRVPFIVGRGVLLDVAGWKGVEHLGPGEPVSASDLEACAASANVEVRRGDIVLLRTGWMRLFSRDRELFDSGEPGLDTTTLPWLAERDVVAVGADNHGVEVMERIPPGDIPVHRVAIRDLGIYLLENLNLEELATDRAREFLFVVAPLRLTAGAGSPINPVAIT